MEQRRIFRCWNCRRNFSLSRELEGQLQIEIVCPFCYKEGLVNLNNYLEPCVEAFNTASTHNTQTYHSLNLPEVIHTTQVTD
ncbi:MAG: hypothetical protein PVI90_01600 [Desulfobacteraceae bacterium]